MSSSKKATDAPAREEVPSGTVPARPSARMLPQVTPSTPFEGGAVSPSEQAPRAPPPEWRERPATPNGPGLPKLDMATVPMMKTPAPTAAHQASTNHPPAPRTLPRDMLVTQPGVPGPFLPPPQRSAPIRGPSQSRPLLPAVPKEPVFESPAFEEPPVELPVPDRFSCVFAWFVDLLCIAGLLAGLVAVVEPSAFGELKLLLDTKPSNAEWAGQFMPVVAAGVLLAFIYVAFFGFAFDGVSPGRRLGGLRLVDASGASPGPLRAVLRAAFSLFSFALGSLGFLVALFTPERKTLHDLLTGTKPVRR